MKKLIYFLGLAVLLCATACSKKASTASVPANLTVDITALPTAESGNEAIELDKALMPFDELLAIYNTINADEEAGALRGLTYPEFRDKYMKGIDGIVIERNSFPLSDALGVSWFTTEKKTGWLGPVSLDILFQRDSASDKYLYMGAGHNDLVE